MENRKRRRNPRWIWVYWMARLYRTNTSKTGWCKRRIYKIWFTRRNIYNRTKWKSSSRYRASKICIKGKWKDKSKNSLWKKCWDKRVSNSRRRMGRLYRRIWGWKEHINRGKRNKKRKSIWFRWKLLVYKKGNRNRFSIHRRKKCNKWRNN